MNKTAVILSFVSIGLALIVVFIGFRLGSFPGAEHAATDAAWTPDQQRALANKLKGAGVTQEAIEAYVDYVNSAGLDGNRLANLAYTIGTMYMDAGRYEDALSWLYRVEIAAPDSSLTDETASKIISCLEHIGKYSAAEYTLGKTVAADQDTEAPEGSRVVARIGSDAVYAEDVNEAIDALPEWMREKFKEPGKKAEFLKKYVAEQLLYRKALKLEYDKDPDVRTRVQQMEKQLLVNKVIESEIKDDIAIDPDDMLNFFKAHRNDYAQKEAVRIRMIKAGMQEIADNIMARLQEGSDFAELAQEISLDNDTARKGGLFPGWVRRGEADLGIGNAAAVSEALFSASKGDIAGPVEAGGYYYIFRIENKRQAKPRPFEECAEQVKNDYYMQKLSRAYEKLLDQAVQAAGVKLFPEALEAGNGT